MSAGGGRFWIVALTLTGLAFALVSVTWSDATTTDLAGRLAGPRAGHWLGQDGLGRDVLARVVFGARVSFAVAAAVVGISLVAGVAIGSIAALAGGWTDLVIVRAIDVVLAFPGLLLAIALAAVWGPGVGNVVLALSALGWTGYARLARSEVMRLRQATFVESAEALGASPLRLTVYHVLPLALPALLVQATFGVSGAIVAEASLSFLGLGTQPPTPSWGAMLNEGRNFLLVAPHLALFPGFAVFATVLGINFLGDGLRDWLGAAATAEGLTAADTPGSRSSTVPRAPGA
jgi:peptide/nickel transport system permease protein